MDITLRWDIKSNWKTINTLCSEQYKKFCKTFYPNIKKKSYKQKTPLSSYINKNNRKTESCITLFEKKFKLSLNLWERF